jgi:hypothetical protein
MMRFWEEEEGGGGVGIRIPPSRLVGVVNKDREGYDVDVSSTSCRHHSEPSSTNV